jgi:hypothetical protein
MLALVVDVIQELLPLLILAGVTLGILWVLYKANNLYDERGSLRQRIAGLDAEKAVALQRVQELQAELKSTRELRGKEQEAWEIERQGMRQIADEKTQGFPWLAKAYADYYALLDRRIADGLAGKAHPARKAAEEVREAGLRRRHAETLWREYRYQINCYEDLFPWLRELREIEDDELLLAQTASTPGSAPEAEPSDPARQYLTSGEYEKLTTVEKYQLALDRYWLSRKSSRAIGRDYERFVGYLFEREGWEVVYFGIGKGFEDLGRDLVVTKDGQTCIVQCKCWSRENTIHEKHVFQLYGTTIEYFLSNAGDSTPPLDGQQLGALADNPVKAAFYTSTALSERAREFARALGITVREDFPLQRYPCIKCNYTKEHGRIYHLPFDQQYDRTKIQDPSTERFVETVAEAEALGYRRAHRWRGAQPQA